MADQEIKTNGGTFIGKDVNIDDGDFIGRDKVNTTTSSGNITTTTNTNLSGNLFVAVIAVIVVGIISTTAIFKSGTLPANTTKTTEVSALVSPTLTSTSSSVHTLTPAQAYTSLSTITNVSTDILSPTLILSSYLPDGTSEKQQLRYQSQIENGHIFIQPDDPFLHNIWNGGELIPWKTTFSFPILDIKIVNNTTETVFFYEAVLKVKRSKIDSRPIPIIYREGYEMELPLGNIGWGPMENSILHFKLDNMQSEVTSGASSVMDQYPFELKLGDINNLRADISLASFFKQAGIEDGVANVLGILEYGQTDQDGKKSRKTHRFAAVVATYPPPNGALLPPTYLYDLHLKTEGNDYTINIPISHSLKASETDRFLFHIAADKSSIHEFTFVLYYNNDEEVESKPVTLELFLPTFVASNMENQNNQRGVFIPTPTLHPTKTKTP